MRQCTLTDMKGLRWIDSPIASRIFAILLSIILSYFGYEKVEEYRASKNQPASATADVKVNIEAGPAHSHPTVVGRDAIKALIREAIEAQHEKDLKTFSKKEAWENGG